MIRRLPALAGALAGALTLSQFPEFSQQYLQRLAGRVEGLGKVVEDFDASARASGLGRAAALAELHGTPFLDRRQRDMTSAIAEYERLSADLAALRATPPLGRLVEVTRFGDPQTLRGAWADFRPAVPVTADGLICAGLGFAAGGLGMSGAMRLMRRRRASRTSA